MKIGWTPKSLRSFKRLIRKNPQFRPLIERTLLQLAKDPFDASLRTHKLKGELADIWSCSSGMTAYSFSQGLRRYSSSIVAARFPGMSSYTPALARSETLMMPIFISTRVLIKG